MRVSWVWGTGSYAHWSSLKLFLGPHAHLGCPFFSPYAPPLQFSRPCSPELPAHPLATTFCNLPVSRANTSRSPVPVFVPEVLPSVSTLPRSSPALLPRRPLGHKPRAAGHQQGPARSAKCSRAAPAAGCRAPVDGLPPERGCGPGRCGCDPGPQLLGLCRRPSLLLGQGGRRAGEQTSGKLPGCPRCDQPQVRPLWKG